MRTSNALVLCPHMRRSLLRGVMLRRSKAQVAAPHILPPCVHHDRVVPMGYAQGDLYSQFTTDLQVSFPGFLRLSPTSMRGSGPLHLFMAQRQACTHPGLASHNGDLVRVRTAVKPYLGELVMQVRARGTYSLCLAMCECTCRTRSTCRCLPAQVPIVPHCVVLCLQAYHALDNAHLQLWQRKVLVRLRHALDSVSVDEAQGARAIVGFMMAHLAELQALNELAAGFDVRQAVLHRDKEGGVCCNELQLVSRGPTQRTWQSIRTDLLVSTRNVAQMAVAVQRRALWGALLAACNERRVLFV